MRRWSIVGRPRPAAGTAWISRSRADAGSSALRRSCPREQVVSGLETAIRQALERSDRTSAETRARIYQSARNALEAGLRKQNIVDSVVVAQQRHRLETVIHGIEQEEQRAISSAPASQPAAPAARPVTPPASSGIRPAEGGQRAEPRFGSASTPPFAASPAEERHARARMQRRASTMSMMIRPILRRARRSAFLSTASGPRVWTPVPRSAWTRRAIGAPRGPMRRRSPPNRVSRATGLPVVWPIGVVVAVGRSRIVSRTAMTSACRAWSRSFRAAAAGGAGSPAWRPSPFFSARSAVPPGGWSAPAFSRRPRRF